METSELLARGRVACCVAATSKKRAIEAIATALANGGDGVDDTAVLESLLGRERLGSTAVGHGVALPHGRVHGGKLRGSL